MKTSRRTRLAASTLAALLCASAASTAAASADTPATSASPTTTAAGGDRSPGCGTPTPQPPGTTELRTITSGGLERTFELRLPKTYRADKPLPLILAYHGRGNTGEGTQRFAGLDELPAVVAYPNGVVGTGDGDRQAWQGAPYSAPGVDDVAFTEDLLDAVQGELCLDTRRTYATGKSNGGGFAAILGCRLSDRVAAIAPVAGAFYGTGEPPCEPGRAVPTLAFHGTDDVTIPYDGDTERGLPAVESWTADWADRNGCRDVGTRTRPVADDVTRTRWVGCRPRSAVELYTVLGGGHTWPGADSYSGGGYTTHSIEASEVMWDFFRGKRLPAASANEVTP